MIFLARKTNLDCGRQRKAAAAEERILTMKRSRLFGKRILALGLSAVLLFSAFGCASQEDSSSSPSEAKGRYVETELPLPLKNSSALALSEQDGKLKLASQEGVYESADQGKTWQETEKLSTAVKELLSAEYYSPLAAWGPDGGLMVSCAEENAEKNGEICHYFLFDKDGAQRELKLELPELNLDDSESFTMADPSDSVSVDLPSASSVSGDGDGGQGDGDDASTDVVSYTPSNSLSRFQFLSDGSLLGLDANGEIHHIDAQSGKILQTLKAGSEMLYDNFAATKDTLFAIDSNSRMDLYDLSTWKKKPADNVLNGFLNGDSGEETGEAEPSLTFTYTNNGYTQINGSLTLFADHAGEALYLCTSDGVFRHLPDGSTMEQVINGALNSMADPSVTVEHMIETSSGSFKALSWKQQNGGASASTLFSYDYDPDMDAVPEKELKAYALYDTDEMRQSIALYQKSHPDVYINLELGLEGSQSADGENAVTDSDALRTLNASIMAGKGPDLLFLDDMPVENYIEKGLLSDLSELTKNDDLLQNIVSAFQSADGKICAVPTRFTMPFFNAKSDVLSSVTDLKTLADAVEKLRAENPKVKSVTGLVFPFPLLEVLYQSCAPAWFKEDGSLDREKLLEFLTEAKRIFAADHEENLDEEDSLSLSLASFGELAGVGLLANSELLALDTLSSAGGFSCLMTVNDKLDSYSYAPLPGQARNTFIPTRIVGVSAKSTQQEEAKKFVEFLLTNETRSQDNNSGFRINKKALKAELQEKKETGGGFGLMGSDGEFFNLELRSLTDSEIDGLFETIQGLTTPVLQGMIHETVLNEGCSCLMGEKSPEDTVDSILKKVNLYLSES